VFLDNLYSKKWFYTLFALLKEHRSIAISTFLKEQRKQALSALPRELVDQASLALLRELVEHMRVSVTALLSCVAYISLDS